MDRKLEEILEADGLKLLSAQFHQGENKLLARIEAQRLLPYTRMARIRSLLEEMLPGCGIRVDFSFPRAQESLEGDFEAAAGLLKELWQREQPVMGAALGLSRWEYLGEGSLAVYTAPSLAALPTAEPGCRAFEKAVEELYGLRLRVNILEDAAIALPEIRQPDIKAQSSRPLAGAKAKDKRGAVEVLKGRRIKESKLIPMSEVQEDAGQIAVCGEIFSMDVRERRDKGSIVTIAITDKTNTIPLKLFLNADQGKLLERLKALKGEDKKLMAYGRYAMDQYARRMCLFPDDICAIPLLRRMDGAEEKRVELHLHTKMSSMDALVEPKTLMQTLARWGHKAVAITDHGVVQAFPGAISAAKKVDKDFKVVLGMEGYLLPDCGAIPREQDFVALGLSMEKGVRNPSIFEIAALRFNGAGAGESLRLTVDPGMPLSDSLKACGLSQADLELGVKEALERLFDFIGSRVPVCTGEVMEALRLNANIHGLDCKFRYVDPFRIADHLEREEESLPGPAMARAGQAMELLTGLSGELDKRRVAELPVWNAMPEEKAKGRRSTYHIILLAKTQRGLQNLYRLVSFAHLKYLHKVPRIPRSLLMLYREDIILGSACEAGELFRAVLDNAPEEELLGIAAFYDYLEIQPIGNNAFLVREEKAKDDEGLRALNKRIVELADKLHKPTVATGDVHFLEPEDAIFRAILMSARDFKDAEQQAPLYLKTTGEMLEEFSYLGREKAYEVVVTNTQAIAAQCEKLPAFLSERGTYAPEFPGANEELRGMAEGKAHEIYGDPLPEVVQKRLDKELNSIIGNGYASLYLMAQRLVHKSMSDGYLVGSRGSVGSSFVANMAGITEVNALQAHYVCPKCRHSDFDIDQGKYSCGVDLPDKDCPVCGTKYRKLGYEIPFETFLGFKGDKTPDIDLNFSGEYQPKAHAYTEVMFGKGHAFRAGTISGLQEKTVYGYVMHYANDRGLNLNRDEVDRLIAGCAGVKRTTGQHPGGIVIVPEDHNIYEFTPVQHPADKTESGVITTHFDFHAMDDRLVKLDILGHVDPTALRMMQDLTGLNPRDIPLDDPETMALFRTQEPLDIDLKELECDVGSIGIPEFGTSFVRQMLMDTRPTTMDELVRIAGLSHGTDVWLGNAQDLVRSGEATLKDVICTRDDIMNFLILKGGDPAMSFKTMESVRKGRGLSPEMEEHIAKLPVPSWFADSCRKIGYMFPRAHAAAYVMMAFRVAYYKVHYPLVFYAVYFYSRAEGAFDIAYAAGGAERVLKNIKALKAKGNNIEQKEADVLVALEVVYEMNLRGIELLPVDLYKSKANTFGIEDGKLRPPFSAIAGVGGNAAEGVEKGREGGPYLSIEDFQARTKANSAVVKALRDAGCLDGLPETNQLRLF